MLIESDLIFDDTLFPMILNDPYPNLALVAKYETWIDGTMVRLDDEYNIVNFIPKKAFKYSDVDCCLLYTSGGTLLEMDNEPQGTAGQASRLVCREP